MADTLYFNRDTRVFIKLTGQSEAWEIPVLDGFSFSQATNSTEVSLKISKLGSSMKSFYLIIQTIKELIIQK